MITKNKLETTVELKSTSKARGERLRIVRMMTCLTRHAFQEKYNISASTIQSWEAAKAGGLTERGAMRILPVLHKEGIHCTADWLLHGIGQGPHPTQILHPQKEDHTPISEDKAIVQELLAFRQLHANNAIDLVVLDNSMGPHYQIGDYVAGIKYPKEKIAEVVGLDCIVYTVENNLLFRRLKKGSEPHCYNLICINANTSVYETTLYDQELSRVAPVVWHRRRRLSIPDDDI